jgi:UDP-glucose 4-epimerase
MSLDEAVDLVAYAFEHGNQGDSFVKKAPACTIAILAQALKEVFDSSNPVNIIGTRHGEKLYETLLTREEMAHAEDLPGYFRIPADNRNLNYGKFFVEGESKVSTAEDYNSHNTDRLDCEQVKELLLQLPLIQQARRGEAIE